MQNLNCTQKFKVAKKFLIKKIFWSVIIVFNMVSKLKSFEPLRVTT